MSSDNYALMTLMGKVGENVAELASLIAKAKAGDPQVTNGLDAIESTLADVVEALQSSGVESVLKKLVDAIEGLGSAKPPTVTVNVEPTPVTVEAVMPPSPAPIIHMMPAKETGQSWQVTIPGRSGEPARTMTIERLS